MLPWESLTDDQMSRDSPLQSTNSSHVAFSRFNEKATITSDLTNCEKILKVYNCKLLKYQFFTGIEICFPINIFLIIIIVADCNEVAR